MKQLTIAALQAYLHEIYGERAHELGMFMKLVEEMGEVAEVLNIRAGRKSGDGGTDGELAAELADVIHYAVAIAAINHIDLSETILAKDRQAAVKYQHPFTLTDYLNR